MPSVFFENGFRYHFFSREGDPREPSHIHVTRPGGTAKLWLFPEVKLAYNRRLTPRELRLIEEVVTRRRQEIADAWNTFFAGTDER